MKPYTRNIEQHKQSNAYYDKSDRQYGPSFRSQGKHVKPKYTRPVNNFRQHGHEFIDE
jgi:hypothetical protein